ncbi:MAG: hypothetical protein IPK13_22195 [Deltaproteobacteria bacterium]|nr:hypothetical protein [Deltaproteobacteria bacterium]
MSRMNRMSRMSTLDASAVRARLRFAVENLRRAGLRTQAVDAGLSELRQMLERRAGVLRQAALESEWSSGGEQAPLLRMRSAQAQAVVHLARRAALQDILRSEARLVLVASMAVSRWIAALAELAPAPVSERVIRTHIDAGRLAHRMLVTLRPRAGLRSGCGQLASATVVAEFVHPENLQCVEDEIEEGLFRGHRLARSVNSEALAVQAAARALSEASILLGRVADRAEPALDALLLRARTVETEVALELFGRRDLG